MVYLHRYLVSRDQMGISPLYYKDNSMQAVVQKLTTSQNKKVPKYKRRPLATFVLNRYAVLPYACAWSFNATFICNLHPWERDYNNPPLCSGPYFLLHSAVTYICFCIKAYI